MMHEIKVSVILPVYQVELYLERAVDSVLAQTLPEIEILLVDDGSEDASAQICDRYAEDYPDKVRVIHKENQGLGPARNSGLEIARGEYVAFLDSDDTVEPEMYEELYEKAVEGSYDMVMCDVRIHYVEENRSSVVSTYSGKTIDLPDYIAHGNNITYSVNKLFRRSVWENNRYEQMLFEDIALIPALVTRYGKTGKYEAAVYDGMEEVLGALKAAGLSLGVATLKNGMFARDILRRFSLLDYFDAVHGMDGRDTLTKADLVRRCMRDTGAAEAETVLVGDSPYDAQGAAAAGVDFLAVTYGFGFSDGDAAQAPEALGFAAAPRDIPRLLGLREPVTDP